MFGVKNAAISIKYFAARSGSGATIYINDRPVPLLAGENPEYQSPLSPMTCKVFGEYSLPGEILLRLPYLAGISKVWRRGKRTRCLLIINMRLFPHKVVNPVSVILVLIFLLLLFVCLFIYLLMKTEQSYRVRLKA